MDDLSSFICGRWIRLYAGDGEEIRRNQKFIFACCIVLFFLVSLHRVATYMLYPYLYNLFINTLKYNCL